MKYLSLVWASLRRKRLRTFFTLGSILFAFLLYGVLGAIRVAFGLGVDVTGEDRLILIHKVSIIQLLPISYLPRIQQVPGVVEVTQATWFGGIYQDKRNFFAQMAVDPESYLDLYPEFLLPPEQKQAWLATRTGAIVGRTTAEQYGFEVGDRVPIQGTFWRRKGGEAVWEFDVVGIYDGAEKGTDTTQFLFRYDYFDEARAGGEGMTGWYIIRIDDPERAAEIAADIDSRFANSPYETRTTTEKAFVQDFAAQVGDIGSIVRAIVTAVFLIILLVVGTTIAQSVRERTSELAVLKTLGFSNGKVLALVIAESFALAVVGGGLGLGAAWLFTLGGDPTGGMLAVFYLPRQDLALGIAFIALLGFVTGFLPGVQAMRLRIVDALRRVA